jgi:hypothetical protein
MPVTARSNGPQVLETVAATLEDLAALAVLHAESRPATATTAASQPVSLRASAWACRVAMVAAN